MKSIRTLSMVAAAIAAVAVTATMAQSVIGGMRGAMVIHVDAARGSDSNDGRSAATAIAHIPGDPAATGNAAAMRLVPGDRVLLASGTIYRGAVVLQASGSAAAPISIASAPGTPAIIDGGDPLRVAPCPDAAACGGAANWRSLATIDFAEPLRPGDALFGRDGPLRIASAPNPSDAFYTDETADMLEVDGAALTRGEAPLGAMAALLSSGGNGRAFGDAALALWVDGNLVEHRPVLAMAGTTARFDPAGLRFYTDRPSRMALRNVIGAIDQPGEYATVNGGRRVVVMLPAGDAHVCIARGRGGVDVSRVSHVAITGLHFRHFADGGTQFAGVPILSNRPGNRGITIAGNVFQHMVMSRGQGPVILRGASDLVITGNRIDTIVNGSGMRLTGPGGAVRVADNRIHRIGRSGIVLMNMSDALIEGNVISDVRGVHGNGMTAYLANRRVRFIGNTVADAKQAVTFHGDRGLTMEPNNLEFRENLLIGTDDALGVLISWGAQTRGVTIADNILLGGRFGLRLSPADSDIAASGNVGTPMVVTGTQPAGWRIGSNDWLSVDPAELAAIRAWAGQSGAASGGTAAATSRATAAPPAASPLATSVIARFCRRPSSVGPRRIGASARCPA